MFIVLFIRNEATLCLLKDWLIMCEEKTLEIFFQFSEKKTYFLNFWKKKNLKLEKTVLIRKIVLFLGFRKPY